MRGRVVFVLSACAQRQCLPSAHSTEQFRASPGPRCNLESLCRAPIMNLLPAFVPDPLGPSHKEAVLQCREMTRLQTVIVDPSVDDRFRLYWQQVFEDFKANYPFCLTCALMMLEKTQPPLARLSGLQIMEHVVKFRWTMMTYSEREYLKSVMLSLISYGTYSILEEETYVKDAITCVMVEMIKHDWPRYWANLIVEIDHLSMAGDIQAELAMLIMLRLGEEAMRFEKPPGSQCDIKFVLTQSMNRILSFVLRVLRGYDTRYRHMKAEQGCESALAQSSCCVMVAALKAMAGYLDWVPVWQVTYKDCKLLEILLPLLEEPEVQMQAADGLLVAINRLGQLKVRRNILMFMYGIEAMQRTLSAVQNDDRTCFVEKRYVSLKKLCQVVCAIGNLLSSLEDPDKAPIAAFGTYMDILLQFTTHPSQFLCSSTQRIWKSFFNHEVLSRDPMVLAMIPKYLSATLENLEKVGFPSQTDSPRCEYSRFDFASDENFITFFTTYYDEQREVLKAACRLALRPCFQMACEFLKFRFSAPVDFGLVNFITVEGRSYPTSPFFIRLDAATHFLETVFKAQVFQAQMKEDILLNDGLELLKFVLGIETNDPHLLFYVVANISTLCQLLKNRNDYWPQVLTKMIIVIERIGAPKTTIEKIARRNACAFFTNICQDNAHVFLPNFEMLYSHVKQLLSNNHLLLTQKEMCPLMEGLVLISNRFKNYERQKAFLEEFVLPVSSFLLSKKTYRVLSDPKLFVLCAGGDIEKSDTMVDDLAVLNYSRISYCVSTIQIVLRCTRWPSDLEEAKAGGYVTGYMPSGKPIYRNPCTKQVLELLDSVLALIRTQHDLFLPETVSTLSVSFFSAMNFLERTNSVTDPPNCLMDIHSPQETEMERMQSFFYSLYEDCFCILGMAGPSLMQDFYTVDDLTNRLLNSAFVNLENIPDYRICIMLRKFVKPLVLNCPTAFYETLVTPILGPFLTLIHVRLTNEWHDISQRTTLNSTEDVAEINDHQVTLLTREVIGFIVACSLLIHGEDTSAITSESYNYEIMETQKEQPLSTCKKLTELGVCLMKDENARSALLVTVFTSLVWKDSSTCYRSATQLCWPLLNQVISEPLFESAVTYFFTMVLKALEEHKDDTLHVPPLVDLAFHIYVTLRPRYADLKTVMKQVPGIMEYYLEKFDEDILDSALLIQESKKMDSFLKFHKGAFNSLIQGYLKKPLDEKHSNEVIINTPTPSRKQKTHSSLSMISGRHSPPSKKSMDHLPSPIKHEDHSLCSVKPGDHSPSPVKLGDHSPSPVKSGDHSPSPVKSGDHSPSSVKPADHSPPSLMSEDDPPPSVMSEDNPPPSVTSEDDPPPTVTSEDLLPPSVKPEDHSPPSVTSDAHSHPFVTSEDDSHLSVTSEDHPPHSVLSENHPLPSDTSEYHVPSSVNSKHYSPSSVNPGHYSPPSVKPEAHSSPSNEWRTLEPVENEPMVSMEDDSD